MWFVDQVGTVLLSCAFMYDIFWVFVSKKLFHESVMIVVNNPPCLNLYVFFIQNTSTCRKRGKGDFEY